MKIRFILLLLAAGPCQLAFAQTDSGTYPVIGQLCPDITIRNVSGRADSTLGKAYFASRFVILEFWSKYCSACAATFPSANKLHQQFGKQLTFILIGNEDKEGRMRPMYKAISDKMRLSVPFAFDSVLSKSFVPGPVPYLVWIDDKGIVQAVTGSNALTAENIQAFLKRKPFRFYDLSFQTEHSRSSSKLNYHKPFLLDGNGGLANERLYRTILVPYHPDQMAYAGLPISLSVLRQQSPAKGLLQGCATLEELYKFAYTGYSNWLSDNPLYTKMYPRCILDIEDTSVFEVDHVSKRGFYWYSLLMPESRASSANVLRVMQQDLETIFGFNAKISRRKMPCYILTARNRAKKKLRTRGGDRNSDIIEPAEVKMTDVSIGTFIETIFYKHIINRPPIIDKTGIDFHIDADVRANIYDLQELTEALKRMGLDLTKRTRKMKVLIITNGEQDVR